MAWDFSTEPEFQKKLDWVDEFCKSEIEPFGLVFPYAVRSRQPKVRALVKAPARSDQERKGCGRSSSTRSWEDRATGSSSSAC